jgi:calcineurin-like phosphoesterase
MKSVQEQLEYFRDNRKNALCVVNDENGKVFQTFPRTNLSGAIKWCVDCVRVGMHVTMYDVKHKEGFRAVFSDKPEPTAREKAAARSKQINS